MASGAGGGVGDVAGQAFQAVEKALHTPMPFTTGGQTISDRLTAAKHSLAGSQLGKSICKATTEECIGPKKKHLDYLIHCTHEPNVSIPQMANLLIERTQNGNWCVVFKSLVTIHNLMCYGNERFTQYLASCNCDLNLHNFLDKTSINGYEMSAHVRHYGKYISEKIYTYRLCAFDFCKVKRGREDGLMRTMAPDKLLKTLPILQGQVDSLLEFSAAASELTNGIINSAFILLFRDLIRLFACYNDGIINLLEKYFDMNKKNCKDALDMYKKFLARMDNVAGFLKVAEAVGIDKGEIPDLAKAPHSLLEALESHLAGLEGRVYSPSAPERPPAPSYQTSKYLREEEERMSRYKAAATERQVSNPPPAQAPTNPFAQPDLLSLSAPPAQPVQTRSTPIDDILALNAQQHSHPPPANAAFNPFAAAAPTNPFPTQPQSFNPFPQATNPYATQPIRMEAFPRMAAPPPMMAFPPAPAPAPAPVHIAAAPTNTGLPRASGGGDLDGTLASLTANLNLQESREPRPVQWQGSASSNSSQPLKAQSPNQGWAPNFANSTPTTHPPPNDPFGAL